jgi:hypothetical protein
MIRWKFYKANDNDTTFIFQNIDEKFEVECFTDILKNKERIWNELDKVEDGADLSEKEIFYGKYLKELEDVNFIKKNNFKSLIRRTTPTLFANTLVGVQPMSTPFKLVYTKRMIYNEEDEGICQK